MTETPVCMVETLLAWYAKLLRENMALAADQCHSGYGDDYGNHRCREVDDLHKELDTLYKKLGSVFPDIAPPTTLPDRSLDDLLRARLATERAQARQQALQEAADEIRHSLGAANLRARILNRARYPAPENTL